MTTTEKAIQDLRQIYRNIDLDFDAVTEPMRENLILVWERGYNAGWNQSAENTIKLSRDVDEYLNNKEART
jgi:hypothetical protein